jgi:CRP-like cAMP-binding protein
MHAILRDHLTARLGPSVPDMERVLSRAQPVETARNGTLVQQGDVCRAVYFIIEGYVQVLTTAATGEETTRDFYFEQSWVSQLQSFGTQTPSPETLRTPEPSQLLAFSYADFADLLSTVPPFAEVYRQILELSFNNSVYRINTFVSMNALARMKWLIQHQPRILTRVPSRLVASYLGITPETFTRLKAKL